MEALGASVPRRVGFHLMPPLSASALRKQLSSGDTAPLYMLVGTDPVERAAVAAEFGEMIEEDLRAFNVERLYGGEVKVDTLADAARTLPMMAPRRVVIVADADKLLIPKRESAAADAEQERLEAFIQDAPSHATVVFVCGPLDMRRRVVKLLLKLAQVVDCGTIESEADAERWVKARAAREGLTIEPAAVRALVERVGLDLTRLRAGLERVALYAMGQPAIRAEDVRQSVAAGPDMQADFGIGKAIWRNDVRDALRELRLALDSGAMPVMVLGQLRAAAERLPAPRLPHAIESVFQTDIALKSSGGDPRILLERLVVELCVTR
jgi:DNA polymerase-3 subunit delta